MIHEEICTYEVAKLAKKKGFPQDEYGVNIGYYAWDGLRKILLIIVIILCTSCEEEKRDRIHQLNNKITNLRYQRNNLVFSIDSLQDIKYNLTKEIEDLFSEKQIYNNNKTPIYILTLEVKQTTYTLDLDEHVKNHLNTIELQFPTSKEFYNKVKINDYISDDVKYGSLMFNNDFSKLKIKVKNKHIAY